ncbi:receptor-like protein kinase FERONIA [Impatiens glandulifera]|uniref:receptor-like protein kinase FERONIA n=1 Tax=Impatiens glandulifera TaxID=253017 RepID=UPI001FB0926A|nr:receptor-like protein kinase FERONIA [Impatiens glandulifera]
MVIPVLILTLIPQLLLHTMAEPADQKTYSFNCGSPKETSSPNHHNWNLHMSECINGVSRASSRKTMYKDIEACTFTCEFTYIVSLSAGMYFIRLYFLPISYDGLNISKAVFSISANHYTLLNTSMNSSYTSLDTSTDYYTVKEFCVEVEGSELNITFSPSKYVSSAYAFVNRIEILPLVPSDLYLHKNAALPLIGKKNSSKSFSGNSNALELMYRLNVGGNAIQPEDTDLHRTWLEDSPYLVNDPATTMNGRIEKEHHGIPFQEIAPEEVYATARELEWLYPYGFMNLTWSFSLDTGFFYLVRLHFCEIVSYITQNNQREFAVYFNGTIAEKHVDIYQWSGGVGFPLHKDYIIDLTQRDHQKVESFSIVLGSTTTNGSPSSMGPLLNGLEILKISDPSNNLAGLNPFWNRNFLHNVKSQSKGLGDATFIGELVLGFYLLVPLVFSVLLYILPEIRWFLKVAFLLCGHSEWQRKTIFKWASDDQCQYFSLTELKEATKNFSTATLLSSGGFGNVYEGYVNVHGKATHVAIKRRSSNSNQGLHEFHTEIIMLSKVKHLHLVSLIGYCKDDKEMILVYEFMERGTLRDHLYNTQEPPLPWKQRLDICIGAAQGLHYLHAYVNQMIIHRDVKSTNILLNKEWVAKVADFGLSKIRPPNGLTCDTQVSTAVKGSFGYLDPEYYRYRKLTDKSDVYSFGVVLMEVLCARPAVLPVPTTTIEDDMEGIDQVNLADWAVRCYQMGTLDQIIDPYLKGKIDHHCFKSFTEIAIKCLSDRQIERPTMGKVLWNLNLACQQQEAADAIQNTAAVATDPGQGIVTGDLLVGTSELDIGDEFSQLRGR